MTISAQTKEKRARFRFSKGDDLDLLKYILLHNKPFHRGSPAWEQIAQKLQATHEGKSVSPRACLDRVLTLLKDHSREDGKLKKR